MASPSSQRIEEQFHEQWFGMQNGVVHRVERAISEGRDLAYAILDCEDDPALLKDLAERWLENFGRSPINERRRAG